MEYTIEDIHRKIAELSETEYQAFNQKLLTGIGDVAGVRLPALRKFAGQLVKGNWRDLAGRFLECFQRGELCHEERILWGLVIAKGAKTWEEALPFVTQYLPAMDSWALCDTFSGALQAAESTREEAWPFVLSCLKSQEEYVCRLGSVLILNHFLEEAYLSPALKAMEERANQDYYSNMAAAWAISLCYLKFPEETMAYLKDNGLDDWTYNKALQKICESLRLPPETKAMIRSMKRKNPR